MTHCVTSGLSLDRSVSMKGLSEGGGMTSKIESGTETV